MSVFDLSALALAILLVTWMTWLLVSLVRLWDAVSDLRRRLEAREVPADDLYARLSEPPHGGCGGVKASE